MSLWPEATDEKGGYWNCVFFVTNLHPIFLPLSDLNEFCGYEMKVVQGFMPINDQGIDKIIQKFGSVEKFIEGVSTKISHSEAGKISVMASSEATAEELEGLDQLVIKAGSFENLTLEWQKKNIDKSPQEIQKTIRVLQRSYGIVKKLKELYENKCQICGLQIPKKNGGFYSEVAHIKPLATRAVGVDASQNLIVLCPNHHKMLDYSEVHFEAQYQMQLSGKKVGLLLHPNHNLNWPL